MIRYILRENEFVKRDLIKLGNQKVLKFVTRFYFDGL